MSDGKIQEENIIKTHLKDKNRYWKIFQYIKSEKNYTTFISKSSYNEIAVTMYKKRTLVRAYIFFKSPVF